MPGGWRADPVEVGSVGIDGRILARHAKPGEAVFSGSIIRQGEIGALVYATGTNTYFARPRNWCRARIPPATFNALF